MEIRFRSVGAAARALRSATDQWKRFQRMRLKRLIELQHGPIRPSFNRKMEEERRLVDLAAAELGLDRREMWDFDNTVGIRSFAERAGVRVPAILSAPSTPRSIDFGALPESFVLKPTWGSGSAGVRVLERRRSPGDFLDHITYRPWSVDELIQEHERMAETGRISPFALIEERVASHQRIPFDWKLFMFQGRLELVLQVDRNGSTLRRLFYDGHWRPLGRIHHTTRCDASLPGPHDPRALVEVARRVSTAAPVAFLRVDLYESLDGVVLGEITPRPGNRHFRPEWDERLGIAWEEAEARLRVQLDRYSPTTSRSGLPVTPC